MRLRIYDASWLIHYGSTAVKYRDYTFAGYPLGGLKYLVKHVADELYKGSYVIVCFDSKTNKNTILPEYKSNRHHDASILSQSVFAYNMLMKCGITCLRMDNYEADDLIASSVLKYRNHYDEIVIISNDRDLAHNVFKNVKVEATSIDGIDINAHNFIIAAAKSPIEYNTISAYKVLTGDISDHIPVFKSEKGVSGIDIYKKYVKFGYDNIPDDINRPYIFSKKELFNIYLENLDFLTDIDYKNLKARIDVIYPRIVDMSEKPTESSNIVKNEAAKLLSIVNENIQLEQLRLKRIKLTQEEFNSFKAGAQVLRDGTFAIDNDCPVHSSLFGEYTSVNMRLFD